MISMYPYPRYFIFVLVLVVAFQGQVHGEIYRWVDKQGRAHFSDQPPLTQKSETIDLPEITTYEGVSVADVKDSELADSSDTSKKTGSKKVVMYSAEWCGVCKKAKKYFHSKKIPFKERDIDKSKKARKAFEKLNGKGIPVILVGKKRMNGFSVKRFESIYKEI